MLRLEEVGLGIVGRNDHRTDVTDVDQYDLLLFTTLCNYNALQVRANASIVVSRLYFLNIPGRQRNDRPINMLIFEGASSVDTPTSCRVTICLILYVNLTYTDGHIRRHFGLLAEIK